MKRNLIIAFYSHPDYYPPTLNALEYLARTFDEIYIVHRNVTGFGWEYPQNVHLLSSGYPIEIKKAERKSQVYKVISYIKFTFLLLKTIRHKGSKWLLVYDFLPWLAIRIVRPLIPKIIKFWYHNHDVAEAQYIRKGSISWAAWKSEQSFFPKLSIFSLPALERKQCFPMNKLKGQFYFIPNYPSLFMYQAKPNKKIGKNFPFRILYQGSIGPEHGIEEIISILNNSFSDTTYELVLKGFISDEYKNELIAIAKKNDVLDKVFFIPPSNYSDVIENAKNCHIGIGIHKKQDMMNKTLGTASNKIYEYAASGMPVILFDNAHFKSILGDRQWVVFTDVSKDSLNASLLKIKNNFEAMSAAARRDFETELCFEKQFKPLLDYMNISS